MTETKYVSKEAPASVAKRLADWYEGDPQKRWVQRELVSNGGGACLVGGIACMVTGNYFPAECVKDDRLWNLYDALHEGAGKETMLACAKALNPKKDYSGVYARETVQADLVGWNNAPERTAHDIIALLRRVEAQGTLPA